MSPVGAFLWRHAAASSPVSMTPEASHLEGRCHRIVVRHHHLPPGFSDRHAAASFRLARGTVRNSEFRMPPYSFVRRRPGNRRGWRARPGPVLEHLRTWSEDGTARHRTRRTQTGHAQPERDMRRAGEPYSALMLCRAGRWNVSITLWCRFASDGIRRCSRTPDENSEVLP